jgi:hypothetical protein
MPKPIRHPISEIADLLCELTEACAKVRPGSIAHGVLGGEFGYGCDIETDTFRMFPYYWGDCTCGHEEREMEWGDTHPHSPSCYQSDYQKLSEQFTRFYNNPEADLAIRALCEKHRIPWDNGRGSAIHCTCGVQEAWLKWSSENHHDPECPTVLPNFLHKPSGVRVSWYKWIGRSMEIEAPPGFDWKRCISECIQSLPEGSHPQTSLGLVGPKY